MCFSQSASLGFGVLGLLTAGFLWARGHPARRYVLFLWFALMELIQYAGYSVADQCDSRWNKALALAAFTHTVVQIPVLNLYLMSPGFGIRSPEVSRLIVSLSTVTGALMVLLRVPWPLWLGAPVGLLDGLAERWPEFFSYRMAGSKEACATEVTCGPELCVRSTPNHIAWTVPMLPSSYFAPTFWAHFGLVFLPSLIMGNAAARFTMGVAFAALVATQLLAAGNAATYRMEWPATWCYLSVAMCLLALGSELYKTHYHPSPENRAERMLQGFTAYMNHYGPADDEDGKED